MNVMNERSFFGPCSFGTIFYNLARLITLAKKILKLRKRPVRCDVITQNTMLPSIMAVERQQQGNSLMLSWISIDTNSTFVTHPDGWTEVCWCYNGIDGVHRAIDGVCCLQSWIATESGKSFVSWHKAFTTLEAFDCYPPLLAADESTKMDIPSELYNDNIGEQSFQSDYYAWQTIWQTVTT